MPIKTTKDGRTIRTGVHYTMFRREVFGMQLGRCSRCPQLCDINTDPLVDWSFHVHHTNGRGMGGGKRDDTVSSCVGICGACHRKEHGQ